jgi:RNA polymerase sigma factor (sigma-70 family)
MDRMNQYEWLAQQFEAHRSRMRAVAYRMLGSLSDADDAVQEAWLRLSHSRSDTRSSDASGIQNLGGYLTTVVARICLDMLRSRTSRREEPLDVLGTLGAVGVHVPDPIVSRTDALDPEQEALLADSLGLALLVVLETLAPTERLAFVLHDMFGVPFEEIAPIVGRSPTAARQLASRARRRVKGQGQGVDAAADTDLSRQRAVVDAFLAAARRGDFEGLLVVLDPNVVLRADRGRAAGVVGVAAGASRGASGMIQGARAVARGALTFSRLAESVRPALVNGAAGLVSWLPGGRPFAVIGFTVRVGKIVEIDILADPARLRRLDLSALKD